MTHYMPTTNNKRVYYRQRKRQQRSLAADLILRKRLLWLALAAQIALHAGLLTVIKHAFGVAPNHALAATVGIELYALAALFDLALTILLYYTWPKLMIPVALMIPLLLTQPIILLSAILSIS